jgi:hypothetical protein
MSPKLQPTLQLRLLLRIAALLRCLELQQQPGHQGLRQPCSEAVSTPCCSRAGSAAPPRSSAPAATSLDSGSLISASASCAAAEQLPRHAALRLGQKLYITGLRTRLR